MGAVLGQHVGRRLRAVPRHRGQTFGGVADRYAGIASRTVLVLTDAATEPFPGERAVITIGVYDGLHLGHQAVIDQVRSLAAATGARSAVVTFDRHPATVVRPESAPKLLTDQEQRMELLASTGIDAAVVIPFDLAQSQEPPMSFIERVLVRCL